MRLGQILVAAGRITPAQLDEALRAQVLYGGRLGTNLIELGYLDLDSLALALARRHGIPAALLKHFERCDLTVQSRLPPALAGQWGVSPIGHLADRRSRIAVAAMDPLPPPAASAIAEALRVAPADLVVSIAGELRIRYYLERCYGIPRESRFLRIRRATQSGVPVPPDEILEPETEPGTEPDLRPGLIDPEEAVATVPIQRLTRAELLAEDADATTEQPRVRVDRTPPPVDAGLDLGLDQPPAIQRTPDDTVRTEKALDDAFAATFDMFSEEPPPAPEPPRRDSRPPGAMPGSMIDFEVSDDASQRLEMQSRRRFVRTLSESDVEAEPPPPPVTPQPRGTLARISRCARWRRRARTPAIRPRSRSPSARCAGQSAASASATWSPAPSPASPPPRSARWS
jgi:hypothetical protein